MSTTQHGRRRAPTCTGPSRQRRLAAVVLDDARRCKSENVVLPMQATYRRGGATVARRVRRRLWVLRVRAVAHGTALLRQRRDVCVVGR